MKEENITRVSWEELGQMEDQTDWEYLRNMTEEEIEQNALDDPDNPPWTEEELENIKPLVYRNFEEWQKAHKNSD